VDGVTSIGQRQNGKAARQEGKTYNITPSTKDENPRHNASNEELTTAAHFKAVTEQDRQAAGC
jgi:hypothetical protein